MSDAHGTTLSGATLRNAKDAHPSLEKKQNNN
jgi:hypothetical protein